MYTRVLFLLAWALFLGLHCSCRILNEILTFVGRVCIQLCHVLLRNTKVHDIDGTSPGICGAIYLCDRVNIFFWEAVWEAIYNVQLFLFFSSNLKACGTVFGYFWMTLLAIFSLSNWDEKISKMLICLYIGLLRCHTLATGVLTIYRWKMYDSCLLAACNLWVQGWHG